MENAAYLQQVAHRFSTILSTRFTQGVKILEFG